MSRLCQVDQCQVTSLTLCPVVAPVVVHGDLGHSGSKALTFETDVMGPITVTSTDPTTMDTAYGMLQEQMLLRKDHFCILLREGTLGTFGTLGYAAG